MYPTTRSSTRLACCEFTRSRLIGCGCLTACSRAGLVISWNSIRQGASSGRLRICCRCQAIASPSRSGSGPSSTMSVFLAASRKSLITSPLPLIVMYLGLNPCSTSMPNWLLGRSRTCPMDALTTYFRPSILLIARALAGDSTITRTLVISDHLSRSDE